MGEQIDLDVPRILSKLKPFQRRSVEYIIDRLYGKNPTRRFLLADEVGLGKTLVARGVIAKTIAHLREKKVPQIDVIYICSNQDIARQNLIRLNPTAETIRSPLERITLLPRISKDATGVANSLNLIAITPGTSLDPKSGGGRREERVLIYHMLDRIWSLPRASPANVLSMGCHIYNFREHIKSFPDNYKIDERLLIEYSNSLQQNPDIKRRFSNICEYFPRANPNITDAEWQERRQVVLKLREILAKSCIRFLQPELIILDEFQRFKDLLDRETDPGELAHELFEYTDEHSEARVLLMSATPYKMYTLSHEEDSDDHYRDFLETMRFLLNDVSKHARLEYLLKEFRQMLMRLGEENTVDLTAKKELEDLLRGVICRTERLAVSPDRNGMLSEVPTSVHLEPNDVKSYVQTQRLVRCFGRYDMMEYWKSAPYLLNFMDNYQVKLDFCKCVKARAYRASLVQSVSSGGDDTLLPWEKIQRYDQVLPNNSRLRYLISTTLDKGAWQCLWMPASLPYYTPGGPFYRLANSDFTKRLVFSSWQVVPKAIAVLISYEAERLMMKSFDSEAQNTTDARDKRKPLLNFARSVEKGRLTGMPVLGLLYPSTSLATLFDPLDLVCMKSTSCDRSIEDVIAQVEQQIAQLIAPIVSEAKLDALEDETWYWAAPILLDRSIHPKETEAWWNLSGLAGLWSGENHNQELPDEKTAWEEHVDKARQFAMGFDRPTGRPPKDLARVLAQMVLAGPAISALRALSRISGGPESTLVPERRHQAGQVAWAFRTLFNRPEATALVRGINPNEPYWRRVLEYCIDGNLQSSLDEYAHILKDISVPFEASPSKAAEAVSSAMASAVSISVAQPVVDNIYVDKVSKDVQITKERLRARFAMRFGEEKTEGGEIVFRADRVRQSFNSPFWPFLLITTSVGQEGLDFHPYCHAVVHWNLPSNPVDLEQREGRVHRYEGHAVRKNVARIHGRNLKLNGDRDPWEVMFKLAAEKAGDPQGIKPYWIYPIENGAVIERYVPSLPLSREASRLPALKSSLAVYRMVFGQPRQDDLLEYLMNRIPKEDLERCSEEIKIDLVPKDIR
jgi:hypothetical protein